MKTSKDQLPYEISNRMRQRAIQHFFPNGSLKPVHPGSVLYTDRKGLVAHVSTAQSSGDGGDLRFWYGVRMNHLDAIRKARQAFFVACCFVDGDKFVHFAFPCSASDEDVFICGKQLPSKSKSHFNVELTSSNGTRFFLNLFDGGQSIDASPFATLNT